MVHPQQLTRQDLDDDRHAARYLKVLDDNADARDALFAIFNDPANANRLSDAQELGRTALSGIARFLESDATIEPVLIESPRFRQAVGVMTKVFMAKRGWQLAGRSGPVYGARHFTRTEHYQPIGDQGTIDASS